MEKDRKDRALTPKSAMARNKKPMDNELARALATQYIMNTTNNDSGRFQAEKSRTRSPINSEEYDELSDPRSLFGFESPIEKTPESVIDKPEVEKKRKMSDWYKKNVLYMRPSQDVEHEVVHEKDTLLEDASSRSVSSQGTVLVNVRSKNSNQQGASKYRKEKISRDEHDNKTLDLNSNVERNGEWSGKDENGVFNPAMRPEEMVSPLKLHSGLPKSLLLFLFGFLLFPLWWIGAFYPRKVKNDFEKRLKRINLLMSFFSIPFTILLVTLVTVGIAKAI